MYNTTYRISNVIGPRGTINWIAQNASDVSFIFIDGVLVLTEYSPGTISREYRCNIDSTYAHTIDIFDLPAGSTDADAISAIVNDFKHPVIRWNNVASAKWFYIYYKKASDTTYTLYRQILNNGNDFQWCMLGYDLLEGWYQLKVTAINEYGEESIVSGFNHRVLLPAKHDYTITASGAANVFDFTLGGV